MENFSLGFKKKGYQVFACWIFSGWVRQKSFETLCDEVIILEGNIEKMKAFLDNHIIDLVHWHGFDSIFSKRYHTSLQILQMIKAKGIKVVETAPFSLYDRNLEIFLDQRFFVSESSLVKFFWKYGNTIKKKKLYDFVYNPLDNTKLWSYILSQEEKRELRKSYGINSDDFVIGKIWRANLWKWDDTIIDIIPSLLTYIPNVKIVIRAIPEEKKTKIIESNLEKYFIFLPETVDEKELAQTYQVFDIMLHTSRIGESFGVSLVEALFFWIPVLTKDTDFMKFTFFDRDNSQWEIIKNGFNGFICRTNQEVIEKIQVLFSNKLLYQKIASQNIETSSQFFIDTIIDTFLEKIFSSHVTSLDFGLIFQRYKKRVVDENYSDLLFTNIKAIFEKVYFKI